LQFARFNFRVGLLVITLPFLKLHNCSMAVSIKSWLIINYDVVHFQLLYTKNI